MRKVATDSSSDVIIVLESEVRLINVDGESDHLQRLSILVLIETLKSTGAKRPEVGQGTCVVGQVGRMEGSGCGAGY